MHTRNVLPGIAALLLFTALTRCVVHAQDSWEPVGLPGGGSVQDLLFLDERNVLAGTLYGGMYVSHDAGARWSFHACSGLAVYCFLPASNGHVLAGCGFGVVLSRDLGSTWEQPHMDPQGFILALEGDSRGWLYAGGREGLFRSVDNGITWTQMQLTEGMPQVLSLSVAENDVLFAGTNNAGLLRSTDGGETWSPAGTMFDGQRVRAVAAHGSTVYAASWMDEVYCSTDNGDSWEARSGEIGDVRVNALLVEENGTAYAGLYTGSAWKTTDYGQQWRQLAALPEPYAVISLGRSPAGLLYCTMDGVGILRSADDGESWTVSSEGLMNHRVSDIMLDAGGALYATVYYYPTMRSTDAGRSWQDVDDSRQVARLLACGTDGTLYCARERDGVYVSTDGGGSWEPRKLGLHRPVFRALCVSSTGHLFATMSDRPHYHLPPGGTSWLELDAPMDDKRVTGFFATPRHVYAFTQDNGSYVSEDDGSTWSVCAGRLGSERVFSMASGPDGLYAGLAGEVLRSTDDGASWQRFGHETEAVVNSIAFTPDGLPVIATTAKGVLQFQLGGGWMSLNEGLPPRLDQPPGVDEVLVDPNGILFARMDWHGVFRLGEPAVEAARIPYVAAVPWLGPNYPNPCTVRTALPFRLPRAMRVTLSVTDLLGREIARPLDDETLPAGAHSRVFDAGSLPAGMYVYRLGTPEVTLVRSFVILK